MKTNRNSINTLKSSFRGWPPGAGSKGFTLIEMLVVIAVILTLLGLIMPSLESSRQRAMTVVCGNNLHQIGLGMLLYQNDYDGHFPGNGCPPGGAPGGGPTGHWMTYTWGGSTSCWDSPFNWKVVFNKNSAVFRYAPSKDIYLCPLDTAIHDGQPGGNMTDLSYTMSGEFSGNCAAISHAPGIKTSQVRNGAVANYIVIYEGTGYDTHSDVGWGLPSGSFLAKFHNGKAGLLYADGHVEFHAEKGSMADRGLDPTGTLCTGTCPSIACPWNGNGTGDTSTGKGWQHAGCAACP